MGTARDRAIDLLSAALSEPVDRDMVTAIVDAIIEAARAPESAHTRAMAEQQAKESR